MISTQYLYARPIIALVLTPLRPSRDILGKESLNVDMEPNGNCLNKPSNLPKKSESADGVIE